MHIVDDEYQRLCVRDRLQQPAHRPERLLVRSGCLGDSDQLCDQQRDLFAVVGARQQRGDSGYRCLRGRLAHDRRER